MSASASTAPRIDQIRSLLAEKGYEVSAVNGNVLSIRETSSGVSLQTVLEGNILYFTLNCITVPETAITAEIMRKMLDGENGVSTSYFQLYRAGSGTVAVTLNNFCKLQDMGADDQDDILSCVQLLFADVIEARRLLAGLRA